jgi:hypothetical protein
VCDLNLWSSEVVLRSKYAASSHRRLK